MISQIYQFYLAHIEWLGQRRSLTVGERREFVRWLCRVHPELTESFRGQPGLLRAQCKEVARGGQVSPIQRGLSMVTLKRYAEALTARYLTITAVPRSTFSQFLQNVISECPTEDALKRFLGSP